MKILKKLDKKDIVTIIIIFVIILIFAVIDYFIHGLSGEYAVPSYYFKNKIIFGTLIGLGCYYLIKNKEVRIQSLIFSTIVSGLLQIRYYLEGYSLDFVILFLFIHFVILLVVSYILFKLLGGIK